MEFRYNSAMPCRNYMQQAQGHPAASRVVAALASRLNPLAGLRNPDVPMHMLLPDGKFAIGVDRQLQEFQEQEQQQSGRVVVWADPLRPNHPERVRMSSIFRMFVLANIPITLIIEITAAVLPHPPSFPSCPQSPPSRFSLIHSPSGNVIPCRPHFRSSIVCNPLALTGAKFFSYFPPSLPAPFAF